MSRVNSYKERNKAKAYATFVAERGEKGRLALDNAIRIAINKAIDVGVSKEDQHTILSDWAERSAGWLREQRMREEQQ